MTCLPIAADELAAVAATSGGPEDLEGVRVEVVYDQAVASATAGIWRYSLPGWSVVLKLLAHSGAGSPAWRSGRDPDHWYYWRREADAFASGVLDRLVAPLRTPKCFGVFHHGDGSVAIWLEDLRHTPSAASWDIPRYGLAARHLGRSQGEMAMALPAEVGAWSARNWLRRYVQRREDALDQIEDPRLWAHPRVRELLPRRRGRSAGPSTSRGSTSSKWLSRCRPP